MGFSVLHDVFSVEYNRWFLKSSLVEDDGAAEKASAAKRPRNKMSPGAARSATRQPHIVAVELVGEADVTAKLASLQNMIKNLRMQYKNFDQMTDPDVREQVKDIVGTLHQLCSDRLDTLVRCSGKAPLSTKRGNEPCVVEVLVHNYNRGVDPQHLYKKNA